MKKYDHIPDDSASEAFTPAAQVEKPLKISKGWTWEGDRPAGERDTAFSIQDNRAEEPVKPATGSLLFN